MRRYALFALVTAVLAGLLFWWFSPGQIVKRRTTRLLDLLTLDAGTPPASRTLNSFSLGGLLDDPVALEVPSATEANGTFSRQDLESGYLWLCHNIKESRVRVVRFEPVTVTGDHAVVRAELDSLVVLPTYRPLDGPSDATFEWRNSDDGWRLTRVSWHPR